MIFSLVHFDNQFDNIETLTPLDYYVWLKDKSKIIIQVDRKELQRESGCPAVERGTLVQLVKRRYDGSQTTVSSGSLSLMSPSA